MEEIEIVEKESRPLSRESRRVLRRVIGMLEENVKNLKEVLAGSTKPLDGSDGEGEE